MSDDKVAGGGWIVISPNLAHNGKVKSMRIDRVTQTMPTNLRNNERTFHVSLFVPASVFQPLPNIHIDVPETAVVAPEVTVGG